LVKNTLDAIDLSSLTLPKMSRLPKLADLLPHRIASLVTGKLSGMTPGR
jgi:hypothetical protein